jgi:high frequency lysogenization protein
VSSNNTTAQVLALAGLLQCTYLVDLLARSGQAETENLSPLLNSLFKFDADSAEQVYGGQRGVKMGLSILKDLLDANEVDRYRSAVGYAMSVLYLQGKLAHNTEVLEIIHSRLQHVEFKQSHFSNNINDIASSVAAIYQDTVSTFNYRIKINGSAQQLQNPATAEMIRALLLAAIRSAVLWRQSGGKRWHFLLSRKRLRSALENLAGD